jgi:hypothetical protein
MSFDPAPGSSSASGGASAAAAISAAQQAAAAGAAHARQNSLSVSRLQHSRDRMSVSGPDGGLSWPVQMEQLDALPPIPALDSSEPADLFFPPVGPVSMPIDDQENDSDALALGEFS